MTGRQLTLLKVSACSSFRLCWDARLLNEQIDCPKFKFETVDAAARLMRPGDYMFVVDMKSVSGAAGQWHCGAAAPPLSTCMGTTAACLLRWRDSPPWKLDLAGRQ